MKKLLFLLLLIPLLSFGQKLTPNYALASQLPDTSLLGHKAGTETFTGNKTFNGVTTFVGNISANSVTITPTELGYVGTLTSDAQTQLDAKASLGGATFTGGVIFSGRVIIGGTVPLSSSDTGTAGEIRIAEEGGTWYLYKCIATDTWVRVALATW